MLLSLVSHWLGAWFALALPAYNTYKALAHNPDDIPALARYWSVLAFFLAVEHALGFVLAWLPFYWELRTAFLLYISLPQTLGATYLYTSLVHPWLSKNEAEIDATIDAARSNAFAFCRARIAALIDLVTNAAHSTPSDGQKQASPVDQLKGLWAAYAPSALAALAPNGDAHVSSTAKDMPQPYVAN